MCGGPPPHRIEGMPRSGLDPFTRSREEHVSSIIDEFARLLGDADTPSLTRRVEEVYDDICSEARVELFVPILVRRRLSDELKRGA